MFSKPKPQTPDAERVVQSLEAKKAEAERVTVSAQQRIGKLYVKAELPGSNGAQFDESEIIAARAERDRARDTMERVEAALVVARERLASAIANDAESALAESWQRQMAEAEELRATARTIFADSKALGMKYESYLARRDAFIDACPDFKLPRIGGIPNDMKVEGRLRWAHIVDATAGKFHRRFPGLETFEPSPEVQMEREDIFLSLLGTREIPVPAPAPPPPRPPERVQGPMPRIGRVA